VRASLLETLAANVRPNSGLIALFEAARVYLPQPDDLPQEIETVCAVLSGRRADRWGQPTGDPAGFYDAKAHLEHLLGELKVPAEFEEAVDYAYIPGRTAAVLVSGQRVGLLGQVHPSVAAAFDIQADVAMVELDLDALLPHVPDTVHYQPVPAYPSLEEDLAIIVPEDVPAARASSIIESSPLVRAASLFDVYTGPPVPAGRKSLAFSVSFQAPDRTLTDAEVSRQRQRILERLKRELGAEPRT